MRVLERMLLTSIGALCAIAIWIILADKAELRRDDTEPPTCWEQALTVSKGKYESIVCGYRVYPIKGVKNGFNVRPVKGMTWNENN